MSPKPPRTRRAPSRRSAPADPPAKKRAAPEATSKRRGAAVAPAKRRAPRLALDRHIVEVLMPELVGTERQPSAFLVYLALAARIAGQRVRRVAASYQQLADETGLSRSAAQAAVRHLLERGLLTVQRAAATAVPTYVVERPWLSRS